MNEIHAITNCVICLSPLGGSYKICEICVGYHFCWDCYLSNITTANHELHHPVQTVSWNYYEHAHLFNQPQYLEQPNSSDEEDQEEIDSDNDDLNDQDMADSPPPLPFVYFEIGDDPPDLDDDQEEQEESIDVNAPPWEYSSPEASSSSSSTSPSSSTEEETLVQQFMDTLFDHDRI